MIVIIRIGCKFMIIIKIIEIKIKIKEKKELYFISFVVHIQETIKGATILF